MWKLNLNEKKHKWIMQVSDAGKVNVNCKPISAVHRSGVFTVSHTDPSGS